MFDNAGEVKVHVDGDAGPYIDVELARVADVENILNDMNIDYFKTNGILSSNRPITRIINISADDRAIKEINYRLSQIA